MHHWPCRRSVGLCELRVRGKFHEGRTILFGAISVHGTNGLWGVLSVGLFADGTSNYGGSWNGVTGSVTGLFYGDASQLAAQLIGISTLIGFVFTFSFVINLALEFFIGHRVSVETEVAEVSIFRDGPARLSGIRVPSGTCNDGSLTPIGQTGWQGANCTSRLANLIYELRCCAARVNPAQRGEIIWMPKLW